MVTKATGWMGVGCSVAFPNMIYFVFIWGKRVGEGHRMLKCIKWKWYGNGGNYAPHYVFREHPGKSAYGRAKQLGFN